MIPDTLDFLLGKWQVQRDICDRRLNLRGNFRGASTFIPANQIDSDRAIKALNFNEDGLLCFGTYRGQAHRELQYIEGSLSIVNVSFVDGRPFIDIDLREGSWQSVHSCSGDIYEIRYFVRSETCMEEQWIVRGEKKDYEATSISTRI